MDGLISVIMAVYNCQNTVQDAIESIINQSYQNFELIICDDGSTDKTAKIINECKRKWPNKIIFIQNEKNCHLPYSLNHCLKYAKGEYVARMDGDDISYKNRFENQVNYLKSHKEMQLVGTAMDVFDGTSIVGRVSRPLVADYRNIFNETPFCHATIMSYRYVYENLGGYSLENSVLRNEDLDLWFRFFKKGYCGGNLPESLYRVTDDINALNRRKMKYRINTSKVLYKGYKMLDFPFYYIIKVVMPVLKGLFPKKIYNFFRNKKFK